MAQQPLPSGYANQWLQLLIDDQEYLDALEPAGLLGVNALLSCIPEVVSALHEGAAVATGNRYVDKIMAEADDQDRSALCSWYGIPITEEMRNYFVSTVALRAYREPVTTNDFLSGPGHLVQDLNPEGLGLGVAWLLAMGPAHVRAADPLVVAAAERVRALEAVELTDDDLGEA